MTHNEAIYAAALKYKGVCEVPGPKSNKLIHGWIKQAAQWLDGDDSTTAWCGCFRGAIGIETMTGVPAEHFRARSWINWGRPVKFNQPQLWRRGDTLILKRPGGFHVALYDGCTAGRFWMLGGNQSNAVTIAPFAVADVIGVRRYFPSPT